MASELSLTAGHCAAGLEDLKHAISEGLLRRGLEPMKPGDKVYVVGGYVGRVASVAGKRATVLLDAGQSVEIASHDVWPVREDFQVSHLGARALGFRDL